VRPDAGALQQQGPDEPDGERDEHTQVGVRPRTLAAASPSGPSRNPCQVRISALEFVTSPQPRIVATATSATADQRTSP
jgi:hypothetical protein